MNSSGTAKFVEATPSIGSETVVMPERTPPLSEQLPAGSEPRPLYWTAPDPSPADADDIEAINALIWDGTSLAESIEAARLWNASVLSGSDGRETSETPQASPGRQSDDVPFLAG